MRAVRFLAVVLAAAMAFAGVATAAEPVDLLLVLASNVSRSVDAAKFKLQRDGYVAAISNPRVIDAIRSGPHGRIAICFVEWSGVGAQKVVIDWTLIDGAKAAQEFTSQLDEAQRSFADRTSISGGIDFAMTQFERAPFQSTRRTIDVSGDGTNNSGPLIVPTRDEVLAAGITINGLLIMLKRPAPGTMGIENLDVYCEDCVIGGPGAFVVPIRERKQFIEATRTKLVLEISGRRPELRVVPTSAQAPRISCAIGEKMWQYRWGGREFDFQ